MSKDTKGKYGYIEFKTSDDYWAETEIRKPTPEERHYIILNIIRDYSGKPIRVRKLAELLGVSDRLIQQHLRGMEEEGSIRRVQRYDKNGKQRANVLEYIGDDEARPDNDFTVKNLFDPNNPCGLRDWHWDKYRFVPSYNQGDADREINASKYAELVERKEALLRKNNQLRKLLHLDEKE